MQEDLTFMDQDNGAIDQPEPLSGKERIRAALHGRMVWAVLLALVFAAAGGYLGFTTTTPLYKSEGRVVVENDPLIFADGVTIGNWGSFLQQQDQLIRSVRVAELALASDTWNARGEDAREWSVDEFAAAIDTAMDDRSRSLTFGVSFVAPDKFVAAAGSKAVLQAYIDEYAFKAGDRFVNQIARLKNVIEEAQLEITRQLGQRRVYLSDGEYDRLERKLDRMQLEQLDLKFMLSNVRSELDMRSPNEDNAPLDRDAIIASVPVLAQLQARISRIENDLDILAASGMGPSHLQYKRLEGQLHVEKNNLNARIEKILINPQDAFQGDTEYNAFRQSEEQLSRRLAEIEAEMESLSRKRSQVASIAQKINAQEDIIAKASLKIDELMVERESAERVVSYLEGPIPVVPSEGDATQMAALGALGGGAFGFGIVLLIGMADSRLRHAGDARMGLRDTRMLGILPTLPENFADPEQSERAAHAVHHIRTLLQISNRGTARVFSVTSPAAGSGKSSLSVAMGLSFATSESKTLVIDCDLVGAGLTRRVGVVVNRSVEAILREDTVLTEDQIGQAITHARGKGTNLKDALIELGLLTKKDLQRLNRRQADSALGILDACQGRPFSECVANTGIDNFSVLPIGAAKPQDAGLLSPQALRNLIARAREEYDVVILDTGPCLGSLEASMAAAEADATVLIVSRGDSKAMATRAHDHLESVGANVVGVVFNHALETDLNQSSFASIVSQERRTDPSRSVLNADPAIAARFGPLGSAVAAFGTPSKSPNGKPRRAAVTNGSSNGH
ncbi:MAG: AAA family ATPase [Planctomycetota bacterium]